MTAAAPAPAPVAGDGASMRWLTRVALAFALLGGLVASAVGVMTVVSVVGRALWSQPIQGDVELTQMGVALAISLSLPWCQLHGANIIVDFFTQKTPGRVNRVLDALGALVLAAMALVLSWRTTVGAQAVREAGETTMIIGLPMWWAYVMLAPGLALTALIGVWQAQRHLRGLPASPAADVAPENGPTASPASPSIGAAP